MLLALYILELQTYEQWKLYYATELVSAASCLHVFCSTIVVLVIELGPLVKASVAGIEFDNLDDDVGGGAEDDDGLLLLSMRVNAWFILLFIGGLVIQFANGAVLTGGEALIIARIKLQHGGSAPPPSHPLGPADAKYADGLLASSSLPSPTTITTTTTIVHARHASNQSDPFEDIDLNAVDDDEVSSYERIDPHYYPLKKKKGVPPGGGGGGGESSKKMPGNRMSTSFVNARMYSGVEEERRPVDQESSLANSCDLASEGHLSSYTALDDTIAEAHLRSSGNLLSSFDDHLRSSGNLLSSSSSEQHHRASGNLRSSTDRFEKRPYE